MGSPTYHARVLVLKKTNLSESDLILTLLAQDGSQVRAVAKGARKPKNTFASRMDLFSVCDVLMVSRPNLDIVSEARLVSAHMALRTDIVRMAAAAPVLDALAHATQEDLPVPRLFDMATAALDRLEGCTPDIAPALCAAFLLKFVALLGFRPSFSDCIGCAASVSLDAATNNAENVAFSFTEGGILCTACTPFTEHVRLPARVISEAMRYLWSTFCEIEEAKPSLSAGFEVLHFCHRWINVQLNLNLKSMNYLFTCGLF